MGKMGCTSSISCRCAVGRRQRRSTIPMVAIFVPSLRVPTAVDLVHPLRGFVSWDVVDRLSALRSRIVLLAEQDNTLSVVSELQSALEEYVPVLLGLTSTDTLFNPTFTFFAVHNLEMASAGLFNLQRISLMDWWNLNGRTHKMMDKKLVWQVLGMNYSL